MPEFRQSSFAGGEWAPTLHARQDLERYVTGLRRGLNFYVTEHGASTNRPGSILVGTTAGDAPCRLARFVFSDDQAFVLVFTDLLLQVVADGGIIESAPAVLLEVETPYVEADLARLKLVQSGDVVTITHRNYDPLELKRYANTDWRLEEIPRATTLRMWSSQSTYAAGDLVRDGQLIGFGTYRSLQDGNTGHNPSSSATWWQNLYDENDATERPLADAMFKGVLDTPVTGVTQTAPDTAHPSREWQWVVSPVWADGSESLPGPILEPDSLTSSDSRKVCLFTDMPVTIIWNHIAGAIGYRVYRGRNGVFGLVSAATSDSYLADDPGMCQFEDEGIVPDFAQAPRIGTWPFTARPWQQGAAYRVGDLVVANGNVYRCILAGTSAFTGAGPSGTTSDVTDGATAAWAKATAYTAGQFVYSNGNTYECTSTHNSGAATVGPWGSGWYAVVRNAWKYDGLDRWSYRGPGQACHWAFVESATTWHDARPDVATYFGGRLYYAKLGRIQGSAVNDYANFDVSSPSRADEAVDYTLASRRLEEIRALVGLDVLVPLTASSEWSVRGAGREEAITPTSILARVGSEHGSSWLDPIVVGDSILYVTAKGSRVRELQFDDARGRYVGADLTIYSKHLFAGRTIVDWTHQEDPHSVVWVVLDDGQLLSLTYVPEQKVWAWTRHSTQGAVENVCAIPEGNEDAVYLVVRRTVGGATKRFIERMASRSVDEADPATWIFLDCALAYDAAPASTFSGLSHLEGLEVMALADGYVTGPYTVAAGVITLDASDFPDGASKVLVGLAYDQELEPLDFIGPTPDVRSRLKAVEKVLVEVEATRGSIEVGEDFDEMAVWDQREVADEYGAIPLETTTIELIPSSTWARAGRVAIRNSDPLPVTVLSVTRVVELGGR